MSPNFLSRSIVQLPRIYLRAAPMLALDVKETVISLAKLTALSRQEEQNLVEWLKESARWGFRRSKNQLLTAVQTVISKTPGRKTQFRNYRPGYKWYRGFMRWHAEQLSLRTPQALGAQRAAVAPEDVKQWFKTAETDIIKIGTDVLKQPHRIFNCDESGFIMGVGITKVIAPKIDKRLYQASM
ncbi:tigger transposable element-derived protein 6-like protein [Plakobranchus ocellatus]|uniref:Tigger transposable element-derived protein 6-like protein n=1 Tax=Plakobranchus ocellatus TaxID=259542 RepID=A0AAV4BTL7_9GAST|nr:tigger transposable element-derived protein 6-like protein [Plakobranchus ocellatus]